MEGPTKLGIIIATAALFLFGGIILYDRQKNPACDPLGTYYPEQGREHIPVGSSRPQYTSDPPASGPHYGKAADWGIYEKELLDEQLIHNLEHGGINIFYKPGAIDATVLAKLEAIQKEFPRKSVLAPRPRNRAAIALASWTYLLELESFDEGQIRQFARCNKDKAPEYFPD